MIVLMKEIIDQFDRCQRLKMASILLSILTVTVLTLLNAASADDTLYEYDPIGRLVRVDTDDGKTIVYCYDEAGNRDEMTIVDTSAGVSLHNPNCYIQSLPYTSPAPPFTGMIIPIPLNGISILVIPD